jgi:hypothetical protein
MSIAEDTGWLVDHHMYNILLNCLSGLQMAHAFVLGSGWQTASLG